MEKKRVTSQPPLATTPETERIRARLPPAARHFAALLPAFPRPALMPGALVTGSPTIGGLGLSGGALLTACGGGGLLWSLGRREQGGCQFPNIWVQCDPDWPRPIREWPAPNMFL